MARKKKRKEKLKYSSTLEVVHPDCAGIDIGSEHHYVAVDPARAEMPVKHFSTFTDDLERLGDWLAECDVRIVAMESTGVYWLPLYEILDRRGFEVQLVNPRATRQVSGRKSDVLDSQWIWQLMRHGLLAGAFRPADQVCELRSYVRQRARLTKDRSRSVLQIQKALTEMNVQLHNVISDTMGKTGQLILRDIVAGERDPEVLARHRDPRIKKSEQEIARSLYGNWRDEHLFALEQSIVRYDLFTTQIGECDKRIAQIIEVMQSNDPTEPRKALCKPCRTATERALQYALWDILGVDLTAIPCIGIDTALVIASEVGADLSAFPSMGHFCSWTNVAPGTKISGDKRLSGHAPRRTNRVGQALRTAASNAVASRSFIGASHRGRLARMDKSRAVKATAHQLARLVYALLTRGEEYVERGIKQYEDEHHDRRLRNLKRQARSLGFDLIESAA